MTPLPTPRPNIDDLATALFDRAADCILLLAADNGGQLTIVEANQAASDAHGYSRGELVGQPLTLLDPFTPRESIDEYLRELKAGRSARFDVLHRRRDGSCFPAEVRVSLVRWGGRELILSVERDITERKSFEDRLLHQQRLMQYVISHARSAIAVHDRDLKYIYVSTRYLEEYNVKEHDVIGKHHYEVFPDLPQKWRDVHQRALLGEVSSAEEDPYFREDGTVEWTRWECRPWYESDGSIGGIIVYTEVITDRKRADEERKALERQLNQAMKMEAIGRLAGGVAHDFNNLLTSIMGNISLAQMDAPTGNRQADALREAATAAESAASLTRQLLAFSRKQMIEPRVLDLNVLVANLLKMLNRLIGEDVDLETVPAEPLGSVLVDPGQFEQVLVNLAINARDAMPNGGHLTIETHNVALGADYAARHPGVAAGPYVMLSVSDTGYGMTDEVKRHLFEPFFTTKALGRGTGLGLATIFGIVKQAGGSIEVYSEVGRGTTFKIYFPMVRAAVAAPAVETESSLLPRGGETVLLVEDDHAVRRLGARVLRQQGYTVLEAANGADALALVDRLEGPLDLLLTDVVMPGLNGRELSEQVAARRPGTRILFTSGYTENVIVHHGVVDRHLNFLPKPYTPHALARKVRAVLDASTAANG